MSERESPGELVLDTSVAVKFHVPEEQHEEAKAQPSAQASTNATYYNNALFDAADPHVLYDERGGYYYAYSTDGGGQDTSGRSYYFGIYRSADLVTWEHIPGGALPVDDRKNWGNDWFWAPEVYHNPATGLYFLFYAARSDANARKWFGFADFEEPCKVGVAVSRSPEGPFYNIANQPIDYWPYDPDYHDVNQIMGSDQMKPPATLEEGRTATLGVYIPLSILTSSSTTTAGSTCTTRATHTETGSGTTTSPSTSRSRTSTLSS